MTNTTHLKISIEKQNWERAINECMEWLGGVNPYEPLKTRSWYTNNYDLYIRKDLNEWIITYMLLKSSVKLDQ